MENPKDILHKIRNYLGSFQTFFELVDPSPTNEPLQKLHQTCKDNLEEIKRLLKKLEG